MCYGFFPSPIVALVCVHYTECGKPWGAVAQLLLLHALGGVQGKYHNAQWIDVMVAQQFFLSKRSSCMS